MLLTSKLSVGIDISDRSIEVVALKQQGDQKKVVTKNRVALTKNILVHGRIKNAKGLSSALIELLETAKPKPIKTDVVTVGLPESQVFTHTFKFGYDQGTDLQEIIWHEALRTIPIPKEDLLLSHRFLTREENLAEVVLFGASKLVVEEWFSIFDELQLQTVLFPEVVGTYAGLFIQPPAKPVAVIDIGSLTTSVHIFSQHGLEYSYSMDIAGDTISQKIAEENEMSLKDAETAKKKFGLSDKQQKLFFTIANQLEQVLASIRTTFKYYEENHKEKVDNIILVGGSSNMKGLTEYVGRLLQLPTSIGQSPYVKSKHQLYFLEAAGLAALGIDPGLYASTHITLTNQNSEMLLAKEQKKLQQKKFSLPTFGQKSNTKKSPKKFPSFAKSKSTSQANQLTRIPYKLKIVIWIFLLMILLYQIAIYLQSKFFWLPFP